MLGAHSHKPTKTVAPEAGGRAKPGAAGEGPAPENPLWSRLAVRAPLQTKLTVSQPNDPYEQEADRVADRVMRMPTLQRACATCASGDAPCSTCEEKPTEVVHRKVEQSSDSSGALVADTFGKDLGTGRPLDASTRVFMESRFGQDFGRVRVHTDQDAASSARSVGALAYTVGSNIVFGARQYAPGTIAGNRLLAHELTHVVQQGEEGPRGKAVQRSVVPVTEPLPYGEGGHEMPTPLHGEEPPPSATPLPRPEECPPPEDMECPAATTSPGAVTNTLRFPVASSMLTTVQRTEIDAAAASWHAAGGAVTVRIDGYASAEGECTYNWRLSCQRAQAVARELESPSDGSPGVSIGDVEVFAHGESDEAGRALAPNRKATISIPTAPPPPSVSPPPCPLPRLLGVGRTGCGSGTDFTHFDFPSISAVSEAKLAAWAAARNSSHLPFRSLVSDLDCMLEMDGVLLALGGSAGHAAFTRFVAGTGGTETHGSGSTLGAMALVSGSFLATVAAVQRDIEAQLASQAASGALDPCALAVTPPATSFGFSDGAALKAVIGGTHGERLFATSFTGSIPLRSYTITLRFLICDNFGVDEADLYAPGLFGFWVLQHERSASLYVPFINELDLSVTVSGTF